MLKESFENAGKALAAALNHSAQFPDVKVFDVLHDIVLEFLPDASLMLAYNHPHFFRERFYLAKAFDSVTVSEKISEKFVGDIFIKPAQVQTVIITNKSGFAVISLNKDSKYEFVDAFVEGDDVTKFFNSKIQPQHLNVVSAIHGKIRTQEGRSKIMNMVVRKVLRSWKNFNGTFVNDKSYEQLHGESKS